MVLFLFLALISLCSAAFLDINNDLILRDVSRGIDLTTNLARYKSTITLNNSGSKPASFFYVCIEKNQQKNLASITATTTKGEKLSVKLVSDVAKGFDDFVFYRVTLAESLKAQQTIKFIVRQLFADVQQPHPASITQSEPQLVRFTDNVYFPTPYHVLSQKTGVKLATSSVESYSQVEPTSRKGQWVNYGPYSDIKPGTKSTFNVHFENNSPFIKATSAFKEVEISHWGNAAVEAKHQLVHAGARLKGSFSRLDYQRNPGAAKSAVRSLRQTLPLGAHDIYYRDEIGNISTSAVTFTSDAVQLQLVPRYVLFGGWKAAFCTGYNVPLQNVLSRDVSDPDLYMLNITFGTVWKQPVVVDEFELRVVLPEGAEDIQFHSPFDVDSSAFSQRFTYLDTSGRPVLRVTKAKVVKEHAQYVQITYKFAQKQMLHEPLLLIGFFFTLCLAVIAYGRIDLSLASASGHADAHQATRLGECMARFRDVLERRDRLHAAAEEAIAKLAKTRSKSQFDSEKAAVQDGLDECTRDAMRLAAELETLEPRRGAIARQIDAVERKRQAVHLKIMQLEAGARQSGSDPDHDKQRSALDAEYHEADEQVARLAQHLLE